MVRIINHLLIIIVLLGISCQHPLQPTEQSTDNTLHADTSFQIRGDHHYLSGYPALAPNGYVNVVVEIPAGTISKWETDKDTGILAWEIVNGEPRKVQYLGYPGNYGMIPKTILPESLGGDGDPLDILVLGPPVERGKVIPCRLIGMLELLDNGEQDDKLIAVLPHSPFHEINNLIELQNRFEGVLEIISLWFQNYKGPGEIEVKRYKDVKEARKILKQAMQHYKKSRT